MTNIHTNYLLVDYVTILSSVCDKSAFNSNFAIEQRCEMVQLTEIIEIVLSIK